MNLEVDKFRPQCLSCHILDTGSEVVLKLPEKSSQDTYLNKTSLQINDPQITRVALVWTLLKKIELAHVCTWADKTRNVAGIRSVSDSGMHLFRILSSEFFQIL